MSRAARTRAGLLRHVHPPRRPIAHALSGESCARARGAHARATGWLTSPTRVARAADRGVLSSLRAVPKRGDPMRRIILKPEVTRERSRRAAQANGTNPFLPFFLDALEVRTPTVGGSRSAPRAHSARWIAERERPLRAAVSRPSALLAARDARGATTPLACRGTVFAWVLMIAIVRAVGEEERALTDRRLPSPPRSERRRPDQGSGSRSQRAPPAIF